MSKQPVVPGYTSKGAQLLQRVCAEARGRDALVISAKIDPAVELKATQATLREVVQQRNDLLSALRQIVERDESFGGKHQYAAIARVAIAKAEA